MTAGRIRGTVGTFLQTTKPDKKMPTGKAAFKFVLMTMAAIVAIDMLQTNVMKIPVIGKYLPGGGDTPHA